MELNLNNYPIFFGDNAFEEFAAFLYATTYSQILLLTEKNLLNSCYPIVKEYLPKHSVISISGGEENKNIQSSIQLWKKLAAVYADRKTLLINMGGGVVGDLGGFVAATFKRGIDFIQIPTTLLSMVDSSVGGKTGIDLDCYKNMIGVFAFPKAVVINTQFLHTLPKRQILSGFAEILKHGLIADIGLWNELKGLKDLPIHWDEAIMSSLKIKSAIISADFFEKNTRKALNFGHTIGHALETIFLESAVLKTITHGEAVAAGIIVESHLSLSKNLIPKNVFSEIVNTIDKYYPRLFLKEISVEEILRKIQQDKKNELNETRFTLLDSIGSYQINQVVSEIEIMKSLEYYSLKS